MVASANKKQEWLDYFELLSKLGSALEDLAIVEESKVLAITKGDLPTIDEIMKKEQAFSMTIRGFEQKRVKMLAALEIPLVPLGELANHMPTDLRPQGKRVVEQVKTKYERYRIASDLARKNLEIALGQLESLTGVKSGYESPAKLKAKAERERNPGKPPMKRGGTTVPEDLSLRAKGLSTEKISGQEKKEIPSKSEGKSSSEIGAGSGSTVSESASSRLSQFIRKKTGQSEAGGVNVSQSALRDVAGVREPAGDSEGVPMPKKSVLEALRMKQEQERAKAAQENQPVVTRSSGVNLRQEMLKQTQKENAALQNKNFKG